MRRTALVWTLFACSVAFVGSESLPAAAAGTFEVQLATTRVTVDNLSDYSNSSVATLVQHADRGMATTDPLRNNVAGEMQAGDRVVVTRYGIYWLDIVRRGGLLSGMWAIRPDTSGNATFKYLANANGWSPNFLLPGSMASTERIFDGGQTVNVLPQGGSDGSCTKGKGTFIIRNSANCGVVNSGVKVRLTTSVQAPDRLYQFQGTLYQEGTARFTRMTDNYGNSAQVDFVLTYRFRDSSDTRYDYGDRYGPAQQRARVEISLRPSASIHLGTVVVAGNSDYGALSYPPRNVNYSNTARRHYGCTNADIAPGALGTLCHGGSNPFNFISQPNTLPSTLAAGDFVTQRQTATTGDVNDRQLTYMLPPNRPDLRLPERIDHIWNPYLGVSAFDVDYFNNEDVFVPKGSALTFGFDIQMESPPSPA